MYSLIDQNQSIQAAVILNWRFTLVMLRHDTVPDLPHDRGRLA